jgi:hypothetical protein
MTQVRAFYWNCWDLPRVATDHKMTSFERAKIEAQYIVGYDIVVLNEVWSPIAKEVLSKQYPYTCKTPKLSQKLYDSGLLILSKYPISNVIYHLYSDSADWDWFTSKGILGCDITIEGKVVRILTSHMQAGNTVLDGKVRLTQSIEFIRFLREMKSSPNVFFIGDINMQPTSNITDPSDDDIIREGCLDMIIKNIGMVDVMYTKGGLYHLFTTHTGDITYTFHPSPVSPETNTKVSDGDYIVWGFTL